jgi:hypothetical protein
VTSGRASISDMNRAVSPETDDGGARDLDSREEFHTGRERPNRSEPYARLSVVHHPKRTTRSSVGDR